MADESKPAKANIAVEVKMLGGLSCKLNGQEVFFAPKAASLLGYLLYFRDTPQTRDLLAGRFWYDCSDSVARKRLSNALWKIQSEAKKTVGQEILVTTPSIIRLAPHCTVSSDTDAFQNREIYDSKDERSHGYNEELVKNYMGDLLEGYYDEWIASERYQIREGYLTALQKLVAYHKASSQYDQALHYISKLITADALNETWYREAAKLHAIVGRFPEAVRQYDDCAHIFKKELDIQPSSVFSDLIDGIQKNVVEASHTRSHTTFVGRQEEKSVLLSTVDTVFHSSGQIVLLESKRGLGRTALLSEMVESSQWRGITPVTINHQKTSRLVPFSGLAKALQEHITGLRGEYVQELVDPIWLQQVASFLPNLAATVLPESYVKLEPSEESWRRAEAFAQIIIALSDIKPLLFIVEDAHWCDSETIAVLEHLARRVHKKKLLLCLSYDLVHANQRKEFVELISHCDRTGIASHCRLKPFVEKEVAELVQALWPSHPFTQEDIRYLTEQSSGSPIAITGLIEQMQIHEDRFSETFVRDFFASAISSEPYRDVVAAQLRSLNPRTRKIVDFLSVADMTLTVSEVAEGCSLGKMEVLDSLSQAVDVGLVKERDSGGCSIATKRILEVAYQRVGKQEKANIHYQLVLLCSKNNKPQEVTAYHAAKAGCWLQAYDSHIAAASAALRIHAFPIAVEHYVLAEEAASNLSLGDDARVDELFSLEEAYEAMGERSSQSRVVARLEVCVASEEDKAKLQLRKALLLASSDRFEEAITRAKESVHKDISESLKTRFLYALGSFYLWAGDPVEAIDVLRRSLKTVAADEGVAEKIILGKSLIETQEVDEGISCLRAALKIARSKNNARSQVESLGYMAVGYIAQNAVEAAEDAFNEALRISREIAYRHGEGQTLVNMASMYLLYGRAGKAFRKFSDAKEVFLSLGSRRGEAFVKANSAELHHVLIGDDNVAQAEATEAAIFFRSISDQRHECVCLVTLCSIDMRRGRKTFALKRLTEVLRKSKASGDITVQAYAYRLVGLLETSLGNYNKALDFLEEAERCVALASFSPLLPSVLAIKAEIFVALEKKSEAEELLVQVDKINNATKDGAAITAWRCGKLWESFNKNGKAKENYKRAFEWLQASIHELEDEVVVAQAWRMQEHTAIQDSYETYFIRSSKISLPDVNVPNGKKLLPEDFRTIVWNVSEPADMSVDSASKRRQHRLTRLCGQAQQQHGAPRILDLAKALEVSERTVKRDIVALRNEGVRIKTRKI